MKSAPVTPTPFVPTLPSPTFFRSDTCRNNPIPACIEYTKEERKETKSTKDEQERIKKRQVAVFSKRARYCFVYLKHAFSPAKSGCFAFWRNKRRLTLRRESASSSMVDQSYLFLQRPTLPLLPPPPPCWMKCGCGGGAPYCPYPPPII
jgi:hypothetical protein